MGFGSRFRQAVRNAPKAIGQAGALPFAAVGQVAAQSIQGVAPALSAATETIQANPGLFSAAAGALGAPGLGGLFGGGGATAAPDGGGGMFQSSSGIGTWVWVVIGGVVLVVVVLLRRKS